MYEPSANRPHSTTSNLQLTATQSNCVRVSDPPALQRRIRRSRIRFDERSNCGGWKQRAAKLTSASVIHDSLRRHANEIGELEDERLDAETLSTTKTGDLIWQLIDRLRISDTDARLVGTTKALHHLLPQPCCPNGPGVHRSFLQLEQSRVAKKTRKIVQGCLPGFRRDREQG